MNLLWNRCLIIYILIFSAHAGFSQVPFSVLPFSKKATSDLIYDTSIDWRDEHLSGLLAIKYENPGYHIVLISKVGFTLFDLVLLPPIGPSGKKGATWNKPLPGRRRRSLEKAIVKDFRLLLLTPLDDPEMLKPRGDYQYICKRAIRIAFKTDIALEKVISAETKGFLNIFKSNACYNYPADSAVPDRLDLDRRCLRFHIRMTRISN